MKCKSLPGESVIWRFQKKPPIKPNAQLLSMTQLDQEAVGCSRGGIGRMISSRARWRKKGTPEARREWDRRKSGQLGAGWVEMEGQAPNATSCPSFASICVSFWSRKVVCWAGQTTADRRNDAIKDSPRRLKTSAEIVNHTPWRNRTRSTGHLDRPENFMYSNSRAKW